MEADKIEFIPLGGLGEIGRNMILVRSLTSSFIIDAGVQFPSETTFNIKYLLSDYRKYISRKVKNLVITHGHEDHIGAIPYLLQDFPHLDIHASPFAAELIKNKCQRLNKKIEKKINVYKENEEILIGDFKILFIPVNHSIPETKGLLISHKKSNTSLFYISDFKIDRSPLFEEPFNLANLKKLSKGQAQKYLFIDSTNILSHDENPISEKQVFESLNKIIKNNKRRIFITLFASNLHRIKAIYEIAKQEKRPIFTAGKALEYFISIGKKTQIFNENDNIKDYELYDIKKDKNPIFLLTGCQGDFKGALNRITQKQDSKVIPEENDLFIFSSKTIPGNELRVNKIINELTKLKIDIITAKDEKVHSSGHASKKDIQDVIKAYGATHLIPIHGEYFFLKRHQEFLKNRYPHSQVILLNDEDLLSIDLEKQKYHVKKIEEEVRPILVLDHDALIDRKELNIRRKLALYGALFATIDYQKKKVLHLNILGITPPMEESKFLEKIINKIEHSLLKEKFSSSVKNDHQEKIRIIIQRIFKELYGEKTIISLHLI